MANAIWNPLPVQLIKRIYQDQKRAPLQRGPFVFMRTYNFAGMKLNPETSFEESMDIATEISEPFHLIVWNDEVNTFEWVIETLMEVCSHSYEQAEQCAYIIHFKGNCRKRWYL